MLVVKDRFLGVGSCAAAPAAPRQPIRDLRKDQIQRATGTRCWRRVSQDFGRGCCHAASYSPGASIVAVFCHTGPNGWRDLWTGAHLAPCSVTRRSASMATLPISPGTRTVTDRRAYLSTGLVP